LRRLAAGEDNLVKRHAAALLQTVTAATEAARTPRPASEARSEVERERLREEEDRF
jgi:hypothetical protein